MSDKQTNLIKQERKMKCLYLSSFAFWYRLSLSRNPRSAEKLMHLLTFLFVCFLRTTLFLFQTSKELWKNENLNNITAGHECFICFIEVQKLNWILDSFSLIVVGDLQIKVKCKKDRSRVIIFYIELIDCTQETVIDYFVQALCIWMIVWSFTNKPKKQDRKCFWKLYLWNCSDLKVLQGNKFKEN